MVGRWNLGYKKVYIEQNFTTLCKTTRLAQLGKANFSVADPRSYGRYTVARERLNN